MTKRIILADDNFDYRDQILLRLGLNCQRLGVDANFDEASDGKELVEMVFSNNYNLIFTDYNMPRLSGLEAIAQIREQNKQIPVYMISSEEVNSKVAQRALQLGATGYICKMDYDLFESSIIKAITTYLK